MDPCNNRMLGRGLPLKGSAVPFSLDASAGKEKQGLNALAVLDICLANHVGPDAGHRRLAGPARRAQRAATWPGAQLLPDCSRLRALKEQME
jgi:hypothetical protein